MVEIKHLNRSNDLTIPDEVYKTKTEAETNVYLDILRREISDCSKEEIKEILLTKVGYWHASALKWRGICERREERER